MEIINFTLSPNSKWRRRYLDKGNCNKNILLYCAIIDVICAIFFCYEGSACITCLPHNSWLFEPAFHHHHDIKVFSSQITRPPFSKWDENNYKVVQVNLFQKHLFLHQLTHNMTKDCSLNYKFSMYSKFQAQNMLCT